MQLLGLIFTLATMLMPPSPTARDEVGDRLRTLSPYQVDEVLWLARCVHSETDRANEKRLVAWVVRNRVETHYRGDTYRDVVLEPKQFSAFNTPSPRRKRILSLDTGSKDAAWRETLGIALDVYLAPPSSRPFPVTTRHFYSPVSMPGDSVPLWAQTAFPLDLRRYHVDSHRFKFFNGVDPQEGDAIADQTPAERIMGRTMSGRTLPARLKLRGGIARPRRPSISRPKPPSIARPKRNQ